MNQLKQGIKAESEHKNAYKKLISSCKHGKCMTQKAFYKLIASAHLKEKKNYYSLLKKYKL